MNDQDSTKNATNKLVMLLSRLFPHPSFKQELGRLRSNRLHCECKGPCPTSPHLYELGHKGKRGLRLVAYIRSLDPETRKNQRKRIEDYCEKNGHQIVEMFDWDLARPGTALHDALLAIDTADGLIVSDLDRMIDHPDDPPRDLFPIFHHYFFHNTKHLISIHEGIDTGSVFGQEAMISYLNQITDPNTFNPLVET